MEISSASLWQPRAIWRKENDRLRNGNLLCSRSCPRSVSIKKLPVRSDLLASREINFVAYKIIVSEFQTLSRFETIDSKEKRAIARDRELAATRIIARDANERKKERKKRETLQKARI